MAWFYGYNYHGEGVQLKTFYDNTKSLLQHKGIDFTLTDKVRYIDTIDFSLDDQT